MILYEGPSAFDHSPVVVIATGYDKKSKNPKTGTMIQTWIIRSDINPYQAVKTGADASVCLNCPQRWNTGGGCYVNIARAPLNVFKKYKRGGYKKLSELKDIKSFGKDYNIRIGSYGDPAVIPIEIWESLVSEANMYTGYTHAWRSLRGKEWKNILMASVDRQHDVIVANMLGWRTFRTGAVRQKNEMTCPASKEAGYKMTCMDCNSCDGSKASGLSSKNVVINVHGIKENNARRLEYVDEHFMQYFI